MWDLYPEFTRGRWLAQCADRVDQELPERDETGQVFGVRDWDGRREGPRGKEAGPIGALCLGIKLLSPYNAQPGPYTLVSYQIKAE